MLFDCGHDWFQVVWLLWLGKMWILGGHLPVEGVPDFFINFKKLWLLEQKNLIDFVTKENVGFMMTFTGEGCCSRESLKSKLFTFFCNIIYDGAYLSPTNLPMCRLCTYVLSTHLCVPMSYLPICAYLCHIYLVPTCAFPTHGSATGQDFLSGISAPFRPHSLLLCLMGHCKWISIWICLVGSLLQVNFNFSCLVVV